MPTALRVALIHPPFASVSLPSLGLATLSAGLKQNGFTCQSFYWNLDVANSIPLPTPSERLSVYRVITERSWYPFNEWVFVRELYDCEMDSREAETLDALMSHGTMIEEGEQYISAILALRRAAKVLINSMAEKLETFDVIGIGTTFYQNLAALALAKNVKTRWPTKKVVLGGANCDGEMGRNLAELFPFLDGVFSGEVDFAFPEYVNQLNSGLSVSNIGGLHWRDKQKALPPCLPLRPLTDLDKLPQPDFSDWVSERKRLGFDTITPLILVLESSRGCWWGAKEHCTFCGLNANGMAYRRKTVERFKAELNTAMEKYGARRVFMADNILPLDYPDNLSKGAADENIGVELFYEVKSNMKRSQVVKLAAGGVKAVQPGIESFSSDLLALMRKGVTGIQNVAFIKYAQELGIRPVYNLLTGFPGENADWHDSFIEQVPRLTHLRPASTVAPIEFHRFSPYHQKPSAFGINLQPSRAYEYLYPYPRETLERIAYLFERIDDGLGEVVIPDRSRLLDALVSWRKAFEAGSQLCFHEEQDGEVVITDTRPAFGPRRLRLYGFAATLLGLLSEPRSLQALISAAQATNVREAYSGPGVADALAVNSGDIPIIFDKATFLFNPREAMSLFSEAGLVYEERRGNEVNSWLSLAFPTKYATVSDQWE